MICDFCHVESGQPPEPVWWYPARDFITIEDAAQSTGNWAACEACAAFIERDDLMALAIKNADAFDMIPDFQAEVIGMLTQVFMRFQASRLGPRTPINSIVSQ